MKKLLCRYFGKKPVAEACCDGSDVQHPFGGNFTKVLGIV